MNENSTKNLFVSVAAGIFIGAALFDVLPELLPVFGIFLSLGLLVAGFVLWFILKKLTDVVSKGGFAIVSSLAFWLHSALEGTVVALSFGISFNIGLILTLAMILHLFPEFLAIVAILKGEGVSTKKSIAVDLVGIVLLIASAITLTVFIQGFSRPAIQTLGGIGGGAFLYIGSVSFWKRTKNIKNYLGLSIGLLLAIAWAIFFKA